MPVTSLDLQRLKCGELFAMHKAIAMSRYERTPDEVTEGFCTASGVVDGRRIEPRELFWQRFKPLGSPNGRVIVVSPRYGLTGRDYYDLVNVMNGEGYDVFTMDHQWAGLSEGVEGTLDSGYSIARDVASMVAYVSTIQDREYGPQPGGANTILVGQGLGASAGVLGANFLNSAGQLKLDGRNMPTNLSSVVLTPYFKSTKSIRNQARRLMGRLPVLSRMTLTYHEEVSIRMDTPRAAKGLLAAIEKVRPDLNRIRALLEETAPIYEGQTYLIHGARDPFIDPDSSIQLASRLGERGTLRMVDTRYPETESSLFVTRYITDGLNSVVNQSQRYIHQPNAERGNESLHSGRPIH